MKDSLYIADSNRYESLSGYLRCFHRSYRYFQEGGTSIGSLFHKLRLKCLREKYGLEIPVDTKIGKGLYLGHAYNITINPAAVIGKNCNIHKGVLIGQENRGCRKGAPVIGDCVWIGANAVIVGKITIGSDVLIAPNSYVNVDVPSHSVVFGNPCIIKQKENATKDYINRVVD